MAQIELNYPQLTIILNIKDMPNGFEDDVFEGNRFGNYLVTVQNIIKNAGVV